MKLRFYFLTAAFLFCFTKERPVYSLQPIVTKVLPPDGANYITKKIIDKIFQPFFTPKPTGQGTDLDLSLSYDVIKAHRGEILVNAKENEGTTFTIILSA